MGFSFVNKPIGDVAKEVVRKIAPPGKPPGAGFGASNFKPPPSGAFPLGLALGLVLVLVKELFFPRPANQGEDEFLNTYKPRPPIKTKERIDAPYYGGNDPNTFYNAIVRTVLYNNSVEYTSLNGFRGKCRLEGSPYMNYVNGYDSSGAPIGTWIIPWSSNNGTEPHTTAFSYSYKYAEIVGFVPQSRPPDNRDNPPPLQEEESEQGTPNPVNLPNFRPPNPYTDDEFYRRYGFPPRLDPKQFKPPDPSKKAKKVPKPENFPTPTPSKKPDPVPGNDPSKDGVKTGTSPEPLKQSAIVPSPVTGGKTTIFTDDITKIRTPDGSKIVRVGGGGGGAGGGTSTPPPQISPTFEEIVRRSLQDLTKQSSDLTQITNVKEGICQSLKEPKGCAKPIIEKLDKLLENDDEPEEPATEDVTVKVGSCSEEEAHTWIEEEITLTVPKGLGFYVKQSLERQAKMAKEICLADCSPPLPQDWQGKRSIIPPQAVLVYRRLGENAKGYNKISIPWLTDASPSSEPLLPNYTKGQTYGALYFTDNSKFIIYCSSKEEAESIIQSVINKVLSDKLDDPPRISFGERRGMPIRIERMALVKQYYYPNGRENSQPAWMRYIKGME